MKKLTKTKFILTFLLVTFIAFATSTAHATLLLYLDDPDDAIAPIQLVDGGSGAVGYSGPVGPNWTVNFTAGIQGGPPIDPNPPVYIDLVSLNKSTAGAGTIIIALSADNMSFPVPNVGVASCIGGTLGIIGLGATLDMYKYYDMSNTLLGLGTFIHSMSFIRLGNAPSRAFSGCVNDTISINPNQPFSITDVVVIGHDGKEATSFNANNTFIVPEPGTLMLLGSGLLGIAGYARVKFGRKKKEV